jgi:hypothetical protein
VVVNWVQFCLACFPRFFSLCVFFLLLLHASHL